MKRAPELVVTAETDASAGFGRFGAAVLLDDAASEARFGGPKDNFCCARGIGLSLARTHSVKDAFGVEMLRVEACLGQAWLKRQRVLRDPGLIDDPRPPPKRREPSA